MAPAGRLCCAALLCGALSLCSLRAAPRQPDTLYLWIDAQQARVLIGFEEDILIVSEGKMAPFTHDFRKAQQRMPAIPVGIHAMNFTWQATGRAEYYYEFLSLHSLDKGIMADPTINIPLLGTVPHKASVVQVGFPCLGKQDGVAAFEVNVIIMNSEGNIILQTPQNAIFFKTCQQAECPGGCRNGGVCNERHVCECPDGFYGPHCEKALCVPRCMNGGLCITPGLCICPPGFYGINCDKGKRPPEPRARRAAAALHSPVSGSLQEGILESQQTVQQPVSMEGRVSIWENAFVLQAMRETNVKLVNAINPVEMEANVLVRTNASAPKATRETCVQSLSANPAVACMAPVWSPTNASARKAGMGDTAIKGTEPAV
ncbi:wnt inhibitory factor 1 isoform 2-T2 [Geothlypis trichas]